jgi:hypothetical protein
MTRKPGEAKEMMGAINILIWSKVQHLFIHSRCCEESGIECGDIWIVFIAEEGEQEYFGCLDGCDYVQHQMGYSKRI